MRSVSLIEPADLGLSPEGFPVRKIRSKTMSIGRPGYFPTRKTFARKPIRTETMLEMAGFAHLEINPRYVHVAPQPHVLTYAEPQDDGSAIWRTFVPDAAVETYHGSIVIVDFKHSTLRALSEWKAKEDIIRDAYLIDHGLVFSVITEESLLLEPRWKNIRLALMHRPSVDDPEAVSAVRAAIRSERQRTTIGRLRQLADLNSKPDSDRAFSAIIDLFCEGEIDLEMSQEFGDATQVSRGPFT